MPSRNLSRRRVLKSSLAWTGAAILTGRGKWAKGFSNAIDRPRVGAIGTGSRWYIKTTGLDLHYGSAPEFRKFGDYVALCDVDANRLEIASDIVKEWTNVVPESFSDYRTIIDRDDIDIIHISTPEHWHAKIAIEAMLAGKDVYCEKPMTLTIDEGKQMRAVCRETGRIVQVGTQQRSEPDFIRAIAIIREGRIGELKKVTCSIGGAPKSPKVPRVDVPKHLDWNQWLGPSPKVDYRHLVGDHGETKSWSRGHYEFRWWYEYSGGKLTDWGAHHVDIATWALEKNETGPISVEPVMVKHPVEFKDGYPTDDSQYNTAIEFLFRVKYEDGKELEIRHDKDNGLLFEGTKGRIFVNRGRLAGKAAEELETNPLPDGAMESVYKGRPLVSHFRNFFEAVVDQREPISDVYSHHRALSTCHLAGIAARLGRTIAWDPKTERVVNDKQAQSFLSREKRKGYEIVM